MSIHSVNFSSFNKELLPPRKRLPKTLALFNVLAACLQYLRDLFFNSYWTGSTASAFNALTAYTKGQRVRYSDRRVYECILDTTAGILPSNLTYWRKVQDLHIGLKNRIEWNAQKLILERSLFEWFIDFGALWNYPTSLNSIYITTNTLVLGVFFAAETSDESSNAAEINNSSDDYVMEGNYVNNAYAFTIYVPSALHAQLGPNTTERDGQIKALVDKLIYAGMKYNIITY